MQIKDLSKELNIQNKDLISYLKKNGFKVSSHMQAATDEMIDSARSKFSTKVDTTNVEDVVEEKVPTVEIKETKKFNQDDMIPCKSLLPHPMIDIGLSGAQYRWEYFGDIDYIKYSDLQAMRRKAILTAPYVMIMDEDLCYQWRRELEGLYKYYLGVDYPEDFFDLPDDKFEEMLLNCPKELKHVIMTTAMVMIKNENYPSLNKIHKIDEILGTCIKESL